MFHRVLEDGILLLVVVYLAHSVRNEGVLIRSPERCSRVKLHPIIWLLLFPSSIQPRRQANRPI